MSAEFTNTPLFSAWPFWVLELDPAADNRSIERAFQKLTSSLQLNIANAKNYMTPLGLRPRDEFLLREARAILTNPDQRALAEFWYMPAQVQAAAPTEQVDAKPNLDWRNILRTP